MKKATLLLVMMLATSLVFSQAIPAYDGSITPTITKDGIQLLKQNQPANREALIVLTFEGLGDLDAVLNYYNGGTSQQGYSGTNYGVSFGPTSLSLIDADAGGQGNTGNEPSGQTVLFFLETNAILNVAAGFTTGFSFYYAAPYYDGHVYVYGGLDGTGALLGDQYLPINGPGPGDPNGVYSNWSIGTVAFDGTAKSIVFGGTPNYIVYDDVTFGSVTPGPSDVPISNWALFIGIGLILIAAVVRFRRVL
jgi:hypothetical protein